MITLYGTGPMFNLPHASPFAIKAEVLLKMSGVDYQLAKADIRKAPKGKMPWIDDGGTLIPDSAFIKKYLEDTYNADFSGGYDSHALAAGLAFERMMEDHVYWMNTCIRWLRDDNFNKGPVNFFKAAPKLVRPLVIKMVRSKVAKAIYAHGMSRHSEAERDYLMRLAVDALSDFIGSNDYLLGTRVCGADASVYGHLASLETAFFDSPAGDYVRTKQNLVTYLDRMRTEFFPDLGA